MSEKPPLIPIIVTGGALAALVIALAFVLGGRQVAEMAIKDAERADDDPPRDDPPAPPRPPIDRDSPRPPPPADVPQDSPPASAGDPSAMA